MAPYSSHTPAITQRHTTKDNTFDWLNTCNDKLSTRLHPAAKAPYAWNGASVPEHAVPMRIRDPILSDRNMRSSAFCLVSNLFKKPTAMSVNRSAPAEKGVLVSMACLGTTELGLSGTIGMRQSRQSPAIAPLCCTSAGAPRQHLEILNTDKATYHMNKHVNEFMDALSVTSWGT